MTNESTLTTCLQFGTHWQVIMVFINIRDHISPTSVLGNVGKRRSHYYSVWSPEAYLFLTVRDPNQLRIDEIL